MSRAISECREGFRRVIGNGRSIKIMEDKWVNGGPLTLKDVISIADMNLKKCRGPGGQ